MPRAQAAVIWHAHHSIMTENDYMLDLIYYCIKTFRGGGRRLDISLKSSAPSNQKYIKMAQMVSYIYIFVPFLSLKLKIAKITYSNMTEWLLEQTYDSVQAYGSVFRTFVCKKSC